MTATRDWCFERTFPARCQTLRPARILRSNCETQQLDAKLRRTRLKGNSATPSTQPSLTKKRSCAFLKTHLNPCFKIFRPMKPGLQRYPSKTALCPAVQARFIHLQTLHSVQLPIPCRAPRPAWAAGSFALHAHLHKKRTQGPSAGGGISALTVLF